MKKGTAAIEASILILIIIAVLVGYLILVPEEVREDLLDDEDDSDSVTTETESANTLLSASPGEIRPAKSDEAVYGIDPIKIYSRVDTETQTLVNSFTVARTILHNDYKEIFFDVDYSDKLDSLEVIFFIVESKGRIKIDINGNEIYFGELTSNELPLNIPISYLKKEDNILRMETQSPGVNIFSSNYYMIQDLKLISNYISEETEKTRTFSISNVAGLKTATLSYYLTCNSVEEGILTISLNNREVFRDDVFCEYLEERRFVFDEEDLRTTNTLDFKIDKGDYNIEEIEVEMLMDTRDYPTYSFDVDSDDYDEIVSGEKEVFLEMNFGDDSSHKAAVILVQEESFNIDTYGMDYEKEISSYVDNGANTIKIEPSVTFDIDNLKVVFR